MSIDIATQDLTNVSYMPGYGTETEMAKYLTVRELAPGVSKRLHVLMGELGLGSVRELAEYIGNGCERSAVSNWLNGYNLPPIPMTLILCKRAGVTLDWIYGGDLSNVPSAKAIRLEARLQGMQIPTSLAEPESKLDYPTGPAKVQSPTRQERKTVQEPELVSGVALERRGRGRPRKQ